MHTGSIAPLFVGTAGAMTAIGVSRATLYRLIDAGRLERVKLGGKTLISVRSIAALTSDLLDQR